MDENMRYNSGNDMFDQIFEERISDMRININDMHPDEKRSLEDLIIENWEDFVDDRK